MIRENPDLVRSTNHLLDQIGCHLTAECAAKEVVCWQFSWEIELEEHEPNERRLPCHR